MRSNLNMETTENPGNSFSQQCSSCDAPSFSSWCLDCHEALCEDCVSAHRRVSVTRSHRLLNQPPAGPRTTSYQRDRGDISTPPTKFCRVHPSEPLKLFCLTCNQLTCRDCQLMTHMSHRYEFVGEALDSLKKQLEDQVQPIRAQRDTVRQTLQDMEARLQDIIQYESSLKFEMQQSFSVLQQHLTKRMQDVMKEIQKVYESECEWINKRMVKLKQVQQSQQSVTEIAEKAKNTNDLLALTAYRAQIESQLKDLPDQDLSPPQIMPQMKVVTERNSVETLLNFGQLDISWIPFSVSQTSSHTKETLATTTFSSSITISPATHTCSLQSLSYNLCPLNCSTSASNSTSCSSSPSSLIPSCKALQTGTTSSNDSPLPLNQSSMSSKSLSSQLCCPTSSSCSSFTSSTLPAPPTSTCPTPSFIPLLPNRTTNNCVSGAPVSFLSTSDQLHLPPPSSSFKNSNSSSTATPAFIPSCPNPQNTMTNYKHLTSLQLVRPPSFTSFSSSSTVSTPTATYPAPTCKPLSQSTTNDTLSLVPSWKSSSHKVYLPLSSSLFSTSSSSPSSWAPPSTQSVSAQLSPAVSSWQYLSQSMSSPTTTAQHVQPMASSTMTTLSHLQTNPNQVQIKCVQPLNHKPVQSNFPPSAGSSLSCTVLKPAPQSMVLHQPPAPHQNQSPVVLLTNSQTVYQLSCWPLSLPSPVPLLPMLNHSLAEKTCPKQPKQCSLLGNIVPRQVSPVSGSDQILPVTAGNHTTQSNHRQHHQTTNKDRGSVTPSDTLTSVQGVFSDIRPDSSSLKHEQQQSRVVKAVADSACDRSVQQVEMRQQKPVENEPNSTMGEDTESAEKLSLCETTYSDSEEPESVTGQQEDSEDPESVTGQQGDSEEPESVTGQQGDSEEPESVTGQQENSEEPESVTGQQGDSEDPESVTGQQGDSEDPESVTGQQGDSEEPESVTGQQGDSEEPESVTGQQGDSEEPESVTGQQGDSEDPESVTGQQGDSEDPESVTGQQGDSEEPESVTGQQGDSEEPESLTGQQEDSEDPESVTGQQGDSEDPESVTGQQEDSEDPESVIRQNDCSLSQLQPKVLLFRLPVTPSQPGCPLPGFRLVPGVAEDEIYLEEMSEDSQSHVDDESEDCENFSEPPSSPESPVTLQIVSCSACGSANGSIICLSCGRGYHRECHVPAVGPDIWSEWNCSLCQDPSDPYISERPQSPSRSLLDQRRCESLLLYLKVEGCSRLSQSGLKLISERLTLHRPLPYPTAAEFLSDVWTLFKTSSLQDNTLNKLQERFHVRLVETFGSELHPSLLTPPNADSQQQHPKDQITSEAKLKETRKRLRQFLVLVGNSGAKRMKKDMIEEGESR